VILDSNIIGIIISFALSFALGLFFKKFKIPTIIAYISAGILLSNNTLANFNMKIISDSNALSLLSSFSLMLLLMISGIKFPLVRIWKYANTAFIVAIIEVFFSVSAIYLLCHYLFRFSAYEAAFISVSLAPSSAILLDKIIQQEKPLRDTYLYITLAILMIENVMFGILITILGVLITTPFTYVSLATQLSLVTLFTGLLLLGGSYAFPIIFEKIAKDDEILNLILIIALTFTLAFIGSFVMINPYSSILLTGIVISSIKTRQKIEESFRYIEEIACVIFYFFVGFILNIWQIKIYEILLIIASLYSSKILSSYFSLRTIGYDKRIALNTSTTIILPGEISLILAFIAVYLYGLNFNILNYVIIIVLINYIIYYLINRFS
jgi:CPA2 family monovalent cation:H+ antiporter-2